jgi:hypothetical protein
MKTIFQPEEIKNMLISKWDELQGENILSQINKPSEAPEDLNFAEGFNKMYHIGRNQGVIEGQIKFLNELMNFFEVEK